MKQAFYLSDTSVCGHGKSTAGTASPQQPVHSTINDIMTLASI